MSHQQQKDKNKQVGDTANLAEGSEVHSDYTDGDKTTAGNIRNSKGIAIGTNSTVIIYENTSQKTSTLEIQESQWHSLCAILQKQNQTRLTTNSLTYRDGVSFALQDIYVPLELVERKQRPKHSSDTRPENSSQLYLPEKQYEVYQPIQDDEFFERVLRLRQSEKSKGQRIAIIGEPGSGKTTLIQKTADWLLNTQNEIAIWVSLSNLQGKSLKDYLQEDWLEAALPYISPNTANVNEPMQNALATLFNSGSVWLLLDGVDEMSVDKGNPLGAIAQQLTGWVGKARVILTCRLNFWDVDKNTLLDTFDTYRTLEFSYGNTDTKDQVGNFISNWFKNSDPDQGKQLQRALYQSGKERIKDLVKNPLRLALLCRIWQSGEGELPDTKAKLYSQYVNTIYKWKQEQFGELQDEQQQALNKALGKLAVKAIDSQESRFRLRENFVREELGKPHPQQLQLALNLGWLNRVGVTAEKLKEDVYAFLHATFQEYFASHAIADWRDFLNYVPNNPEQGIYRIFAPHWKEVILLWLEQPEANVSHLQKQEFIEALVDFKDRCHGDNMFKTCTLLVADCLMAAGLTNHPLYPVIYEQLVEIYRHSSYKWLQEQGFQALKRLHQTSVFRFLKEELNYADKERCLKAIKALGELGTEQAVELLASKYLTQGEEPAPIVSALIAANTDKSREMLKKILDRLGEDEERSLLPAIITQLLDTNRLEYINLLIDILQKPQTPYWMQMAILKNLGSIDVSQVKDVFLKRLQAREENISEIVTLLNTINFLAADTIIFRVRRLLESGEKYLVVAAIRFLAGQRRISQEELVNLLEYYQNQEELQKEILQSLVQIQNSPAEKYALEKYQDKYASPYLSKEWIEILGKFGRVDSFEYLSEQLQLLMNDSVGNREVEAAIIQALYQITRRLPEPENVNHENFFCQHILIHLQLSPCGEDNLAEAAVYLLLKLGTITHLQQLLKLAKQELHINEALLYYINKYPLSRNEKIIYNWINERVMFDDELTSAYFNLKVRFRKTEDEKREILIAAIEGNRPLLCREALEIAYNLLKPEEMLSRVRNLLECSDSWVVEKAIEILGKIGDAGTIKDLLPFIKNNQHEQEAFKALFEISERCLLLDKLELRYLRN